MSSCEVENADHVLLPRHLEPNAIAGLIPGTGQRLQFSHKRGRRVVQYDFGRCASSLENFIEFPQVLQPSLIQNGHTITDHLSIGKDVRRKEDRLTLDFEP